MPELLAIHGGENVARPVGTFHGVAHPAAEDGAVARHGGGDEPVEIVVGQTGTGGIVHQHPLPLCHMQPVEHRMGALATPFHPQHARVGGHGQRLEPAVMGSQRHDHPGDGRMGEQALQGMLQDALPCQRQILFRAAGAHAAADAGGRDYRGQSALVISHRRERRQARSPGLFPWG